MKKEIIHIDNLKCRGCENTIVSAISKLEGITSVKINHETSEVVITKDEITSREIIVKKLSVLGYPEAGTSNMIHKAKSYVSCAIGKVK